MSRISSDLSPPPSFPKIEMEKEKEVEGRPVKEQYAPAQGLTLADIRNITEQANNTIANTNMKFRLRDGQPPVILIVDPETDEIIKEIPSKQMQKISEAIRAFEDGNKSTFNLIDEYT